MKRRDFMKYTAAGVLAPALTGPGCGGRPSRPNIVIFLSDDMSWAQPGYNGGTTVPTPNIDRIAAGGVKLTQFYVQPVCSPTRACLMTGRYAWKNGMEERPTAQSQHGMLSDERTMAEMLKDAGYATWMVGKWHLGEWQHHHLPNQRGFDHHYGHYSALIDYFTHTRNGVLDWHRNGEPVIEEGYSTFLFAKEAEKLIAGHDGRRPFFLYMPFSAVHGPHQAPEEYVKKYRDKGIAFPEQKAQLDCMDIAIGRVLEALKRKGIERETLIIFLNDNGGYRPGGPNGPYRGGKGAYYEGGIRVPCCLQWPGRITPGTSTNEMLHVIDLYPTIGNLTGADLEQKLPLDGRDAWAAIAQGAASPRKEMAHSLEVLRRDDWKLIEEGASYYGWKSPDLKLYNIADDPSETRNLAAQNPEIVKELRERLAYHRRFVRKPEELSTIPGYPPVVYGERENGIWADELREKVNELKKEDVTWLRLQKR